MKVFMLEYPHFGCIINYCYKRGQHLEDYFLNVTPTKYCILEIIVIALVQQCVLILLANGILCCIDSDFWWLNGKILLVDIWYGVFSTVGYFLMPIVLPNPIFAMAAIFPYVCTWAFTNGVMLPTEDMSVAVRWTRIFSPIYHVACLYRHATDAIDIQVTLSDCYDSAVPHVFLICSLTWFIAIGIVVKLIVQRVRKCGNNGARVSPVDGPVAAPH